MRSVLLFAALATLLFAPAAWGKTVYLKNGDEIECQGYRAETDTVLVKVNDESELEFTRDEVDFDRTGKEAGAATEKAESDEKSAEKAIEALPGAGAPAPSEELVAVKAVEALPAASAPAPATTGWLRGETPSGFLPGNPQLQKELISVYRKYCHAAQSGNFYEIAKFMTTHQAQVSLEEVAKIKDKKELLKRKKVLQDLGVKEPMPVSCAISPDGAVAALVVRGKELHDGKYRDGTGTVKLVKEQGRWRVAFQTW